MPTSSPLRRDMRSVNPNTTRLKKKTDAGTHNAKVAIVIVNDAFADIGVSDCSRYENMTPPNLAWLVPGHTWAAQSIDAPCVECAECNCDAREQWIVVAP